MIDDAAGALGEQQRGPNARSVRGEPGKQGLAAGSQDLRGLGDRLVQTDGVPRDQWGRIGDRPLEPGATDVATSFSDTDATVLDGDGQVVAGERTERTNDIARQGAVSDGHRWRSAVVLDIG